MQNVVAIPFVVPPQAAGPAVPSTDGAFQLSFASESPVSPGTAGEGLIDPTGFGGGLMVPFPLVPHATGLHSDPPTGDMTGAFLQEGILPEKSAVDVGLADQPDPDGPEAKPEGLVVGALDGTAGPLHSSAAHGPDLGISRETGLSVFLPGAVLSVGQGLPGAALSAQAAEAGSVGAARSAVATEKDHAAQGPAGIAAMRQASVAGVVAGLEDAQGTLGLAAKAMVSASQADPSAAQAGKLSADTGTRAVDQLTGHPGTGEDSELGPGAPGLIGTTETAGQKTGSADNPQPALGAGGTGAAKGNGAGGQGGLAALDLSERGAEAGLTVSGALSASGRRMNLALAEEPMAAQPFTATGIGYSASQQPDLATEDPADPVAEFDARDTAMHEHPSTPRREATTVAGGFWERLLTGLSGPVPDYPTESGPFDPTGAGTGHRDGPETDQPSGPESVAQRVKPVAFDSATSSLAVFARGQARLATLSPEPDPESDRTEPGLAALSLPGALPPGLSLPQSSASAPVPSPVPHVAAQISAALSQSADGATELALSPEELGRVRLRLERDANHPDRMVVHITFERPETLDLFRRHAGELAEALREAGYAGADIGFGQQDGGTDTPAREGTSAGADYASAVGGPAEAHAPDFSAPRRMAGASLDLRL